MRNWAKLAAFSSILLSIFIFVGSITSIAVNVFPDEERKIFSYSYGRDEGYIVGFDYENGDLAVKRLGDMDEDGIIAATDARIALRASAKIETLSAENRVLADVDYDSKVTAVDARTILRVSAKLQSFESPFPPASHPPETLGEFLLKFDLDSITSIKVGSAAGIASAEEVENRDCIIDILKNNADAQLHYSENLYDDLLLPPKPLFYIIANEYPGIRLFFSGGRLFEIMKDINGNTWIWNLSGRWAAMLANDKDAYDVISEL